MRLVQSAFLTISLIAVLPSTANAETSTVPFIGCPSDGQVGPDPAPKGKSVVISLDAKTAARLALYSSRYDDGVLAPRGWHCANLEGSSGWLTIIAPEPLDPTALINPKNHPLRGPAIQISQSYGGTSGRFEVAQLIARYFPERRAFLQRVIDEKIEAASYFPLGPYKTDQLVTRQKDSVEYVTPAGRNGLGTKSRLVPSDLPIHSVAAISGLNEEPQGFIFNVRLPKDMDDLAPVILRDAQRRYGAAK